MLAIQITKEWFDAIKERVEYSDPCFFQLDGKDWVEVDVEEQTFQRVSKELGWLK